MKPVVLVVLGVIVAAAGAFGAAYFGLIKVPMISPIDFGKPVIASADEHRGFIDTMSSVLPILAKRADDEANAPKKASTPPPSIGAKVDSNLGDEKIAEIWNAVDVDKLKDITAKWPEKNLAKILLKMDPDQVSEYLAAIPAPRAVKISQAIQQLGAIVPKPPDQTS